MAESKTGCFRVVVDIYLEESFKVQRVDGESDATADAYYQTYGVTANCYSEAAAYVEEALKESISTMSDSSGLLAEMTITPVIADGLEKDIVLKQSPNVPGIHFVSGRILYSTEDSAVDPS